VLRLFCRKTAPSLLAGALVTGCHSLEPIEGADAIPDITAHVTTDMAVRLDSRGHLRLTVSHPSPELPTIDSARASDLIRAFMRTFGDHPALKATIDAQRGVSTDLSDIVQLPRLERVESPYSGFAGASVSIRNALGPAILARFVGRSSPVLTVGVSEFAVEVGIADGKIVSPADGGNEFSTWGSPPNEGFQFPITPEQAVVIATSTTHALVDQVPYLLRAAHPFAVASARWVIHLDRAVQVTTVSGDRTVLTRTLYVGLAEEGTRRNVVAIPAMLQPQVDTLNRSPLVTMNVRDGYPIRFDQVGSAVPVGRRAATRR
jgi:hypothetical protein